jgi:hypothetical protein
MKLTKEEQSNLFDLTANKNNNNNNPNAPKGITATNPSGIRELEENDNLSVSSGAKYKGNVTLVPSPMAKNAPPSGFSQQNQMPPQQHRQFQPQQQPPHSQYTPNYGFSNQPLPPQHSQQQSPPFITVPNANQTATIGGSPGNFSPYYSTGPATGNTGNNEKRSVSAPRSSPNENSNNNFYRPPKPFTQAELNGNEFMLNARNNMNGSPMRLPVPRASPQSLEMYLNGGTQPQLPSQFPSSSSLNVPMTRPQLFPPQQQPSTMSSTSGEMKNQRIPLPSNINYSQQQPQQALHPIAVTSSLSKDTLASMGNGLQPEYTAGGQNRIPLPEAGMVPRTNSSDITTIPPPNIGNNRSKIDLIRKSFSHDHSNNNNNTTNSDSAAIVLPSHNQPPQENAPSQAPLETTSGGETKPINADEERANKVKALAQRFNAIKATTTTSQPPPPPRAAPKVFPPPQMEKKEDPKTTEKAPYPRPWEKKNLNNNNTEPKNESEPPPSRPPPPPVTATHSVMTIPNEKPFQNNSFEEPKKEAEEEGEVEQEQERPSSRNGSPSRSRGWGSLTNRGDNKASVLKNNTATVNEQQSAAGFPFGQANLRKVVKPNNPKGEEEEEDDAPVPIPKFRSRNSIIMMNADKNKNSDDHPSAAGIDADAMNHGIHIPALKRPNLFRPPAPAETAKENDDNAGGNLKAESFLAMLKPTDEGNENFSSSSGPGKLTRPNIFS